MPQFAHYIAQTAQPIGPDHPLWAAGLPAGRSCFLDPAEKGRVSAVSYGDYFLAARAFLEKDDYRALRRGMADVLGRPLDPSILESVDLHLVKHGQFYHPARAEVRALGKRHQLALQVAVSDDGRKIYHREYRCLQRLGEQFPVAFIPRVYDEALVLTYGKGPVGLFLEEWFDGFFEFHLSTATTADQKRVKVWREGEGPLELSQAQVLELIRQAAMILTYYYDPETYEQIYPWHHAAGDFVVRLTEQRLQVRLTTVRDYAPLFHPADGEPLAASDEIALLEGLLVFWLNLSLRMRLDRCDGVGKVVVHDESVIPAMVDGFFKGLDLMGELRALPPGFPQAVQAYFLSRSHCQWSDLAAGILRRYPADGAEAAILESCLEAHLKGLREALQGACLPSGAA